MAKSKENDSGYVPLATQLRDLMRDSGLSIYALAHATDVAQPILQRFASGVRENLRIDTADRLCKFFGVRLTATKRKPGK